MFFSDFKFLQNEKNGEINWCLTAKKFQQGSEADRRYHFFSTQVMSWKVVYAYKYAQ